VREICDVNIKAKFAGVSLFDFFSVASVETPLVAHDCSPAGCCFKFIEKFHNNFFAEPNSYFNESYTMRLQCSIICKFVIVQELANARLYEND